MFQEKQVVYLSTHIICGVGYMVKDHSESERGNPPSLLHTLTINDLTCTFRESCYGVRFSWALVLIRFGPFVQNKTNCVWVGRRTGYFAKRFLKSTSRVEISISLSLSEWSLIMNRTPCNHK